MKLKEIALSDKGGIDKYLKLKYHSLAAYSFANVFIWRRLYKIFYALIEGCLCIFFKDKIGCFAYLSPLGAKVKPGVIDECFKIMDGFNVNSALSRIENIEEGDLEFYEKLGYTCEEKPGDYLCRRQTLVSLKGDKFKSKRAACNYFIRNYKFYYRPFTAQDRQKALKLYRSWVNQRHDKFTSSPHAGAGFTDTVYLGMMEDSFSCQIEAMDNFKKLGLVGRVVDVEGQLSAYTIGYPLNKDTFCILFEITDLTVKGAAQFIFRRFCEELDFKYINIMDDSGLDNLRKVKLSYRPSEIIPSYIIKRQDV